MNKKYTAVVYARYSSHRQGEQSIEGQLAEAYKYANAHGYTIIQEYVDRATTGRNDNREEFQKMLADTAKKQFDTIILWKIDRFGRNREEIAFNKYRCKKNGVKIVRVAESVPDSPEGVILDSVLEGMAEYYSLQLSQNIRRGQRASAEKCQSIGGPCPLGYCTNPTTKRYEIDPETAPTVKLVFDLYSRGRTITEIVKELNSRGLRTSNGNKFTKNSLYSVLKNEKYTGVYTYKDQVRVEGGLPAIVDAEVFAKVQEMLKVNKRAPSRTWSRVEYLLTDKLFCGKCGSKMVGESGTGKSGRKFSYYSCIGRKQKHTCDKKPVRQAWIEDLVIRAAMGLLADDELLDFIANSVWEYYQKQNKDDELGAALRTKLAEVEKATANIIKAIEAGIFNDATKKRMAELDAQRAEIEAELSGIELTRSLKISRDYVLFYLTDFRNGDTHSPAFQKRIVDTFINSVYVYDDKVTVTFNYSSDSRTVTLAEVDSFGTEGEVFGYCAECSTITERVVLVPFFCLIKSSGSSRPPSQRVTPGSAFILLKHT